MPWPRRAKNPGRWLCPGLSCSGPEREQGTCPGSAISFDKNPAVLGCVSAPSLISKCPGIKKSEGLRAEREVKVD